MKEEKKNKGKIVILHLSHIIMEYNTFIRKSLISKWMLRNYISLSERWGTNLTLRIKLRDQNAYIAGIRMYGLD